LLVDENNTNRCLSDVSPKGENTQVNSHQEHKEASENPTAKVGTTMLDGTG